MDERVSRRDDGDRVDLRGKCTVRADVRKHRRRAAKRKKNSGANGERQKTVARGAAQHSACAHGGKAGGGEGETHVQLGQREGQWRERERVVRGRESVKGGRTEL